MGEARFGVQMKATDLERCNISAKTIFKLALNLVEFIVPESLIKSGVSVYENSQHKLREMPDNIVQALKGECAETYGIPHVS